MFYFYTEEFESPEHACVHDVSDGSPLGKYSFLSLWKPGMRRKKSFLESTKIDLIIKTAQYFDCPELTLAEYLGLAGGEAEAAQHF